MKKKMLYLVLVLFSMTTCKQEVVEGTPIPATTFFDLKAFFAKELESLEMVKGKIAKTTEINGVKEAHTFDSLDFARELKVFVDSDINRVAWLDKYTIDSTFATDGGLQSLEYQAVSPDLKTQKLRIEFLSKHVNLVQIENLTQNALMHAAMQLEYRVGKGYRIQSNQKLKLSEEREMVVEVVLPKVQ